MQMRFSSLAFLVFFLATCGPDRQKKEAAPKAQTDDKSSDKNRSENREPKAAHDPAVGVHSAAFSSDSTKVLVGFGSDGPVPQDKKHHVCMLFEVASGKHLQTFEQEHGAEFVTFLPGNRLAVSEGQGLFKLWDLEKGTLVKTFKDNGFSSNTWCLSPNGKDFLVIQVDERLLSKFVLLDLQTFRIKTTYEERDKTNTRLAFSPDPKKAFYQVPPHVFGKDHYVKVFDTETGKTCFSWEGDKESWRFPEAFAPDGKTAASTKLVWEPQAGGHRVQIVLWEWQTGKIIRTFPSTDSVQNLSFSPDGKMVISLNLHGKTSIEFWDVSTGKCDGKAVYPKVDRGFFSRDGKLLLLASSFEPSFEHVELQIWDTTRRTLISKLSAKR